MYQNDAQKVLTGECRLSYCNLIQPRAPINGQGDPKYSVTLLIPKTDKATKADIDASIEAAARDAVGRLWGGVRPRFDSVVWDGDGCRKNGMPFGEECRGHWVLTASTKKKPQVVGMDNINVELAPQDIYSGMYGRVTLRFYGYSQGGNRGVACGLGNVMKTRDGEPLSGGASAASDFAGVGNAVVPSVDPVTGRGVNPITCLPM